MKQPFVMDANLDAILKKFTKYVVSQAKSNLTRKKKNVKGNLYNSIKGDTFVGKNSIGVYFEMEDYGVFQDSGIKGKSSGQSLGTFKDGGFRFGSGSGGGSLTESIKQWVRDRKFQFRNKDEGSKGRFLSYDATAFLITRSIWQKGIKPTRFFSKPFEDGIKRLPDEVVEKYGLDVENKIRKMLNNESSKK